MITEVTEDGLLGGRLRLKQPRRGHRFGHDAILLAAATAARPGDHAIELGAGVGAAGLALARRVAGLRLTLLDVDTELIALARANAVLNGVEERVSAVALDIAAPASAFAAAGLRSGGAEHVLMNPPFNDAAAQISPEPGRARAHAGSAALLASWTATAKRLLAARGTLTLIWRAAGLGEVIDSLDGFGAVTIKPIFSRPDAAAIRIVLRAVKGSRAPLKLLPGLLLNDAQGRPTESAEAIMRDGKPLPLA